MRDNPPVAIVVLNYNGADCLEAALTSLHALSYEPKEIIIVDNASEDDSYEQAKKGFPKDIFLKNEKNLGFAGGMNVGIREALRLGAEYVWLFNNDAKADAESLTALIRFCEARPNVGAVSPVVLNTDGATWFAGGKVSFLRMRAVHIPVYVQGAPYQSEYLSGCAMLVRTDIFQTIGFLDEQYFLYYEDVDLSLRIRRAGKELFVVPDAKVSHAERSTEVNPRKLYYLVYSGLIFFRDHTPLALRPWVGIYLILRRLKNGLDCMLGMRGAADIRQAYADYDTLRK